ncbi:replicative DNA helicase [Parabacteroides sp. AM08-6]|uniref:replicative DNA helicase n=1 Tax=Parabacteroides sp. AM08-6 TaxID=2292053 RepID=UPI000EFE1862|nr:replicative DNA helicase [Parabacteroides sp. AM08-6]RHJ78085.1 replicative DNA helicase [Parabacteroides sp. AM08-6]
MKARNNIQSCSIPYSEKVEQIVLGMLMLESTAINEVDVLLKPETFYKPAHALIYQAIQAVSQEGYSPDMVLVFNRLNKENKLNEVGGAYYLSELISRVASCSNLLEHAKYLHQLHLARMLVVAGQTITAKAYDNSLDIDDTISDSIKLIEDIAVFTTYGCNYVDLRSSVSASMELYQLRKERVSNGLKSGISTGLDKLDRVLSGLREQQLIILASRPAMGKTSFALNIALNAAMSGIPVVIFSLEMSSVSLTDRFIISIGRLNANDYRNARLTDDAESQMCDAVDKLSSLPVTIDDTSGLSMGQIKSRAKNLQRKGKCGLVIIDYLQLIDMRSGNKSYTREQEVTQATKEAKQLAKSLNVPVLLLSQLSRKCEERADKTPILSDLRESGSIEQDADVVLMIHRPEYYDKNEEKGVGILRIAKQRDGQSGDINFRYNESLTRFSDYENQTPF